MDPSTVEQQLARLAALEAEATRLRKSLGLSADPPRKRLHSEESVRRTGLLQREALLLVAERVAHLGSWCWDLRTDQIGWSDEFYRILGLVPDEVQPSSEAFWSRVHPQDRARGYEMTQTSLARGEGQSVEVRIVRPNGEVRDARLDAVVLQDGDGHNTHVVGTALDLTEQRRSAHLLARAVDELSEAQHIAGLASWRWDPDDEHIEWSDGMYRLLDLPDDTPPSQALLEQHVHPDDRERVRGYGEVARTLAQQGPIEFRVVRTNGQVRDVSMRIVAHSDATGRSLGFRGAIHDITERKALEEQLRYSQKMEAIGTLAGGVAHEFNNQLMVIAGHNELLGVQLPEEHPGRESLDAIGEAYQRCAQLTQQLLTLSRRRQARPAPIELGSLVVNLTPQLRAALGDGVDLKLALDPSDNTWIQADPQQVEQALMNMVVNARDAMPRGGTIDLRVAVRTGDADHAPQVCLSVSDTGHGIPPELHSRIYEPFFTTKEVGRGTGLGLSTVYAVAREAGASIELESELGRGSTFHIAWPRCEVGASAAPKRASSALGERTILLVEDLHSVRELIGGQLERAGYRVLCACDGLDALQILSNAPVDLLLTDVLMPALGGIELVRQVRSRHPDVRCLLMTGYAVEAGQTDSHATSEPLIRKPFTTVELLRAIRRQLDAD